MFDDCRRIFCQSQDFARKKGPSRDHILRIRKIPEKYQENIFS
jgi:hypothetical protein